MAFIKLADLIINVNCIATVRFSTYDALSEGQVIPVVNICLLIPEGSLDSETKDKAAGEDCPRNCQGVEKLEFENELAITLWDYFTQSSEVTVLFE